MKKILSLLIISFLIISMSIPVSAGNLSTYPDVYSSQEKIDNAPSITDIENYLLFWDNAYNCYIRFPFSEGESFSSDGKTLQRYNSVGNSISIVNNLYHPKYCSDKDY